MLPRRGAQIVSTLAEDSWCGREGLQDLRTQSDVIFGLGLGLQACEPRKCASFHFDMVYLISPEAGTSGKHTKRRVAWAQGFAKICWTLKVLSKGGRQSLKITELLLGDRLFLQKIHKFKYINDGLRVRAEVLQREKHGPGLSRRGGHAALQPACD